jgi:hypothetical protein
MNLQLHKIKLLIAAVINGGLAEIQYHVSCTEFSIIVASN